MAGFSLLAIWLLVRLFWLLLAPGDIMLVAADDFTVMPDENPAVTSIDISPYHLFGKFDNSNSVGHRNAPQSVLNLQLRGLLASGDPAEGFAIISDSEGREEVYRVGAALPGDARVEEIYDDRVVISRAGEFESLRLPGAGDSATSHDWIIAADSDGPGAYQTAQILTVALPQLRNQLALNSGNLTNSYGLIPVSTGGYRLSLGRGARQMADLGLQSGDILEAANGVRLDDQAAVENVIQQVMKGQRLNLQIRRNGQVQEIHTDLAAIMQNAAKVGNDE